MARAKKIKHLEEQPQDQDPYDKLLEDLESFNQKFFILLAGSDKFEIVPTTLEDGRSLNKEQYSLINHECSRLGLKVIYQIDNKNGTTVFISSDSKKVGYMHEGMH